MPQVMTKEHPKWEEFCKRLRGPEGCDFREGGTACIGGRDKRFAIRILRTYEDIDIQETINYFEQHGGYCDCEILLNVVR